MAFAVLIFSEGFVESVNKFQFYLFLEQNLHFVFSIDKGVANAIVWYVYDTKWEKGP